MKRLILLLLFVVACAAAYVAFRPAPQEEIVVSAAASLTDVLEETGRAFAQTMPGIVVRFNFGASGSLQRQIEQGAPVDVYVSASPREMDALDRQQRIESSSRTTVAGNRLVLIHPARTTLRGWEDLRSSSVRRVAISDPMFVPSGRYAREVLIRRGLWDTVKLKAVYGDSVRQTLAYVASGDVDAGIVFATDARREPERVRISAEAVPRRDHTEIVYPAAVVRDAPHVASARRFVAFLRGAQARGIFARYGFTVPSDSPG